VTLLTGHRDAYVRAGVINWHAKIAEGRRQREVIDETTLTRVDLETDSDDRQYRDEQILTDDSTVPVSSHISANKL